MRLFSLLILFSVWHLASFGQVRTVTQLKDNWKFSKGKNDSAFAIGFDDKKWATVQVPHDWAITGPFDKEVDKQVVAITQNNEKVATEKTGRTGSLPFIGEGWYRNNFTLPNYQKGERIILQFEGAMSQPKVFLNGQEVGSWNYGYNYFYFDITDRINASGNNLLAVHLSNPKESSRWYPGAGLYRNVSIIEKDAESIDQWGIYITTPVATAERGKINIKTTVTAQNAYLVTEIRDAQGRYITSDTARKPFGKEFDQNIGIDHPLLWSPESPSLYTAYSRLYTGNVLKDEVVTRFGIREISFKAGVGFTLNGKVRKIKGVCLHHDLGPLGSAVNKAALRRQMQMLKDLGCDAIRSSHNMPSWEQLELADEMGFMFLAESFDEWAKPKVKNGYAQFFNADAEKDIVNLVRATRNHPCIIMWSSGNEVPDQWGSEGVKRAKWLNELFHREDPTRPVTIGMDQVKAVMQSGFGGVPDIPGMNYRTHLYEEAYQAFPQGLVLGSETASTVSSRGIYKFPVEKAIEKQYDDYQCSSYDMEYCSWSNLPEEDFILQDDKPWVIGEFVWTAFDYLGEPTPYDDKWPSRSSYFGMIDLAGLPKDRYYLYRSRWNTQTPTLHILPHWNWAGREGQTTPVFAYTSYDKAELFVNGKSMGVQTKNKSTPQNRYRLMWMDVKYEPGTIKVVAYDKNDKPVAEQSVTTAGKPYKIMVEPDRSAIKADGEDISFVTVSIVDKDGNLCPTATDELSFAVKGNGVYKAACNGDATSLEQFHLPKMKAFSGKLVVLVQSTKKSGPIELTVTGKSIKAGKVTIESTTDNVTVQAGR